MAAILKGSSGAPDEGRPTIENATAVEMLRAIPGVQGFKLKRVMSKIEGMQEMVGLSKSEMVEMLGEGDGAKAWEFINKDIRADYGRLR